ncbi:MAG: pyridoxal 5'-phosphate synthase glutaminase subunit PdxT [Syntrophales bacterium LBB04]|nr:pyridoxal 5'-phosphate synthase glutaminase subunit PdxT [Syntrophales bacterium LBB04]
MSVVNFSDRKKSAGDAIGVLSLQGGVVEHLDHLERLGIKALPVKDEAAFKDLAGLIIPGGESTCLSRLLHIFSLDECIVREFQRGMKIWGTCAGALLLARSVIGEAAHLGLIDIEVERNGFGSQLESFASEALIPAVSPETLPLTFIRAPKITKVGPGVEVLLTLEGFTAAAESAGVLVTVFHPELTGCLAFHRHFARKCGLETHEENQIPALDPGWDNRSWTRFARVAS